MIAVAFDVACGAMLLGFTLALIDQFFMLGPRTVGNLGMALAVAGGLTMGVAITVLIAGAAL